MPDIRQFLETVDNVMKTIKGVTDMPGVNLIPYVSTASSVIGAVHAAYVAEKNIEPYLAAINATFKPGSVPPQADLDALEVNIAALEAKVQEPLPAPEDGEPE